MSDRHNKRTDKLNFRQDLYDGFRDLNDRENVNVSIDNLNDEFISLNLQDPENIVPFQDEAGALPQRPDGTETPEIDDINPQTSTRPKTFVNSRFFVNSADTEIRSPRYRSNYAQNLVTTRNSERFDNLNQNRNLNNRPQIHDQQNQTTRSNTDASNRHNNANRMPVNNTNNNNNVPNVISQSINDILQMAILIPNYDGTEKTFENFEIACLDAARILSIPNQSVFMKFIRDKFSGPIKLYIKIKLNSYRDINQMLEDIKKNFMVRTPIHVLENKIYSLYQEPNESVREFGAKLADLQGILLNRIKDKFQGNVLVSKIADAQKKINRQFIQGLKRDLYVQFSLVDFRNHTLDQIIQVVAKNETRNKINENFDKSGKTVNFEQESLNKAELVEALTIAISTDRSRNRERSFDNNKYRDYSRENYNYRRKHSRDRSYSRDRENGKRNRDYSFNRREDSNRYRDYSRGRNRSYSRNRNNSYYDDKNYNRDNYRKRNFSRDRSDSYDRKYERNSSRNSSGDRKYGRDKQERYNRYNRDNSKNRNSKNQDTQKKTKKRNSSSCERDSDDSNKKNPE